MINQFFQCYLQQNQKSYLESQAFVEPNVSQLQTMPLTKMYQGNNSALPEQYSECFGDSAILKDGATKKFKLTLLFPYFEVQFVKEGEMKTAKLRGTQEELISLIKYNFNYSKEFVRLIPAGRRAFPLLHARLLHLQRGGRLRQLPRKDARARGCVSAAIPQLHILVAAKH